MGQVTLSAVGCRGWDPGLWDVVDERMGRVSRGHRQEIEDVVGLGPSFPVVGRGDQGRRVRLVVGEA